MPEAADLAGGGVQGLGLDGVAQGGHEVLVVLDVMPGEEDGAEHFAGFEEVVEVGAAVAGAEGAGALWVEGAGVVGV